MLTSKVSCQTFTWRLFWKKALTRVKSVADLEVSQNKLESYYSNSNYVLGWKHNILVKSEEYLGKVSEMDSFKFVVVVKDVRKHTVKHYVDTITFKHKNKECIRIEVGYQFTDKFFILINFILRCFCVASHLYHPRVYEFENLWLAVSSEMSLRNMTH